jgi:hypothetical protein
MEPTKKTTFLEDTLSSYWKALGASFGVLTAVGLFSAFTGKPIKITDE